MGNPDQPTGRDAAIAASLSEPRLAPFLARSGGNVREALRLYQWNVELSGEAYRMLHVFEVVLRNAMDIRIQSWNARQPDDAGTGTRSRAWLLDPAPLLRRLVREKELSQAQDRAKKVARLATPRRSIEHGDVVAQLTLGTWRFLLPGSDPGRRYLWDHALRHGFPHLERPPLELVRDVEIAYRLRNRVAHLEPLLDANNLQLGVTAVRRVLRDIEPAVEEWFVSHQRLTTVTAERPRPSR